jgi:hypothetical protein
VERKAAGLNSGLFLTLVICFSKSVLALSLVTINRAGKEEPRMLIIAHYRVIAQSRAYAAVPFRVMTGVAFTLVGENTEREKSIMYLTVLEQNRHCVSSTSGFCSVVTFSGKDRRHSVQVITM